jgi:electron transfer DM13
MDAIGRLGREFFTALYDFRIPVAIGSLVAVGVLVAFAWRRGWFAAARRHPWRSGAVLAIAVAVGLPAAWYLASPIWIRTSLVEAAPTVAPAAVESADPAPSVAQAAPTAPPSSTPTSALTEAPTPFVPATLTSGKFHGTDDFHFGRGTASIVEVAPGRYHLRLEDFSVRNGPDLYVYLSTSAGDYTDDALELGRLKATDGSFGYDLPPGTEPGQFRSAIIWCKQFSHLFAVAPFRT